MRLQNEENITKPRSIINNLRKINVSKEILHFSPVQHTVKTLSEKIIEQPSRERTLERRETKMCAALKRWRKINEKLQRV